MGKRGPKPKDPTSIIWTSELAYAIGLIATDGCLYNDGRHINLTSKDLDQIETFKKCLGKNNKVGLKSSGFSKQRKYYYVQIGDVGLYRFLQQVGLTPRKSLTIGELLIPDQFFFDFLRGSFDGDGTIYSFWDKRWHSSYMFYINFISASLNHLEWLQKKVYNLTGAKGVIKPGVRAYKLEFAKKSSTDILRRMYHSSNSPRLERKFLKALRILSTNQSS